MVVKSSFRNLAFNLLIIMVVNAKAEKIDKVLDDTTKILFTPKDLKVGKEMPLYFGGLFSSEIPHFLPKQEAELIPFSSQKLPLLLEFFGFSPDSPQARAMKDTLDLCEMKVDEEKKFCATSLESMVGFVRETLNKFSNDHNHKRVLKALSTSPLPKSTKLLQNYTIVKQPQRIPSPEMVACHMVVYPYAVFHCHQPEFENQVFEISLKGEDGTYVEAVANCHMNTSTWDPDHVSFRALGFKPGFSPVCHVFPSHDLVWVSVPSVDDPKNY